MNLLSYCCIIFVTVNGNQKNTYETCPSGCKCKIAMTKCVNVSLENFPRLPTTVRELTIQYSSKGNLTADNLKNLTAKGMKITKLWLYNNSISFVEESALGTLTYLQELTMSELYMDQLMLAKALYSLKRTNITNISFQMFRNWNNLSSELFKGLTHTRLQTISINRMWNIRVLDGSIFANLDNLRNLDVSRNSLHYINLMGLSRVISLDASHNFGLKMRMHFCYYNMSNLGELRLQNNKIVTFRYPIKCLPKLRFLDMSNNPFYEIHDNVVAYLPMLETLILTNVGIDLHRVHRRAFKSTSLKSLTFEGSGQTFKMTHTSFPNSIFQSCTQLTKLYITQVNFGTVSPKYIHDLLRPLKHLKELSFESNNVQLLPKRMLSLFPNLTLLSLYDNDEAAWKETDIFYNVDSLKSLCLGHSYISEVTETTFPQKMLDSLRDFDLSNNPFACTCDLLWFSSWLKTNAYKMIKIHHNSKYSCHSPDNLKDVDLFKFKITAKDCRTISPLILFTIIISSIALAFLVIFGVAYRYRWYLKYWIYFLKGTNKRPNAPKQEFLYDAFVIYCEDDRLWVHDTMLPKLEVDNNFKLCIHYRDFEVGQFIIDNIVDSMTKSKKIILVLSKKFLKSEWCLLELRLAQKRCLLEGFGVLVVIILETLDDKAVSNNILRTMLHTTTYAEWSHMSAARLEIFWNHITNALSTADVDELSQSATGENERSPLIYVQGLNSSGYAAM